ncbi:MAG: histidine kinase N-terminal 7TM domain-containing protein, partial [bacterium]
MNWTTLNICALSTSMVLTLLLGLFVYLRQPVGPTNRSFWLFSFSVLVWQFTVLMLLLSCDGESFVYWARMVFAVNVFVPPTFYFFTSTLSHRRLPSIKQILLPYLPAVV